ncbi:hypothetical protein MMC18_000944 [Xylographa bjoerkii]|nr:hypothetical protein [Xylographa bjoerkii]
MDFSDDLSMLLSLVAPIVFDATNQTHNAYKLEVAAAAADKATSKADLPSMYNYLLVLSRVNNCFLYLIFWLVKVSFLMFYRSLFNVSRPFRKVWWVFLVYTVVTFWVPIGGVLATCWDESTVAEYVQCNTEGFARQQKLEYTCVMVVTSNLASSHGSTAMDDQRPPLAPFPKARLDILRTVQAIDLNQALFTILEISFAVIICTLPTYPMLFNIKQIKLASSRGSSKLGAWSRLRKSSKVTDSKASGRTDDRYPLDRNLEGGSTLTSNSIQYGKRGPESAGGRDPYLVNTRTQDAMEMDSIGGGNVPPVVAHSG